MRALALGFWLALAPVTVGPVCAEKAKVVSEDLSMPHGDGVNIFVRNKRPDGITHFNSDRIVVMMHGATFPGAGFDVAFAGKSWMDFLAERGFDVYALDLPGYGGSTRPAAMNMPPDQNPPFMKTSDAVRAIANVVDQVLKRRNATKLNLIGWSWGSVISATYASEQPDKVNRLTLFAPFWLRAPPANAAPTAPPPRVGAYQMVSREQAFAQWFAGVPEAKLAALVPADWRDSWADAIFATDPQGGGKTLRRPGGAAIEFQEFWSAVPPKASYDPSRIASPVLLVVGEWDRSSPPYMAQTLFPLLVNAPWKRLAVISEGTHFVVWEKNRVLLFRTVQQFLEEMPPGPSAVE